MAISHRVQFALELAKGSGLTEEDIERCIAEFSKDLKNYLPKKTLTNSLLSGWRLKWLAWVVMYRLFPLVLVLTFTFQKLQVIRSSNPCLLAQPILHEFAMPVVDCSRCEHISGPIVIEDITVKQFMDKYAFSLQPLLMKGAASDWPALQIFSYEYFKTLYTLKPDAIDHDKVEGQFFPYSSGIHRLDEFMALDSETAALKRDRWYIGWSTTEPFIGEELRKHLKEPYFLPPKASDSTLAWIFMGAPGPGASLHVDWVGRPSWQAQLSGKKTWTLAPPPECELVCSSFNVTVNQGDIIVLDTNSWFHATHIHSGNISITYGTEYE